MAVAVAVAAAVVVGGAAFALSGAFAKPTIEGKWTLTSQMSTPDGTFDFADADLSVKDSRFELTVRRTGDAGKILGMASGDSMTFEGDCILESEGDQLVYGLAITDFSTDVEGVPVESVTGFLGNFIDNFNATDAKLKVPVKGLGSDYPQGEWALDVSLGKIRAQLYADVQAQNAQNGSINVGAEGGGQRDEAARGTWAKDTSNPKSATFEFTQGSITAKITLTRQ